MIEKNESFENIINQLNRQKKELECLYDIDNILKDTNAKLDDILKKIITKIQQNWTYSEIDKIKIKVYDICIETNTNQKFKENISSNLQIEDEIVGEFIIYRKNKNSNFIAEEKNLFQTIVEKINSYLSYRKLKNFYIERTKLKEKFYNEEESFIKYLKELSLNDAEIEKIIKVPIELKKDEIICKQGSFASFVVILKEGLLKAYVENSHNKNHIFKITKPYSIIGLSALYADGYYHFTSSALMPSKLYIIEKNYFLKIIENNPKFAIKIMNIYSNSLQNIYDKIGMIANKQALGKVCDSLRYLSENVFDNTTINRIVTRKDIADFSGLSTENLIRILADLKKDNIIAIDNKVIKILKPEIIKTLGDLG